MSFFKFLIGLTVLFMTGCMDSPKNEEPKKYPNLTNCYINYYLSMRSIYYGEVALTKTEKQMFNSKDIFAIHEHMILIHDENASTLQKIKDTQFEYYDQEQQRKLESKRFGFEYARENYWKCAKMYQDQLESFSTEIRIRSLEKIE